MPIKQLLFVILASATSCLAATTIEVSAKFADVAAGTEVPAKPELLAKMKGVNVLSAPRVSARQPSLRFITGSLSHDAHHPLRVQLPQGPEGTIDCPARA